MVLKLRLARMGKRHSPFYNIVVAHARTARDSLPLEVLGTYNPNPQLPPSHPSLYDHTVLQSNDLDTLSAGDSAPSEASYGTNQQYKDIQLDISRAKYWVGVGAEPSDTVWRILSMVGVLKPTKKMERLGTSLPVEGAKAKAKAPKKVKKAAKQ